MMEHRTCQYIVSNESTSDQVKCYRIQFSLLVLRKLRISQYNKCDNQSTHAVSSSCTSAISNAV